MNVYRNPYILNIFDIANHNFTISKNIKCCFPASKNEENAWIKP